MAYIKKPLIIIPGLGDRVKLYTLIIPIWRLLGYEPYIFSFDWEDTSESFAVATKRLTDCIDNLHTTQVNIIGVSAGGTAAVNALGLRSHVVKRVITVATPYRYLVRLKNAKLKAAIEHVVRANLTGLEPRVLSMYGLYDQVVPIYASQPKNISNKKIYAISHGCIIITALTIYSIAIRQFIEQD